MTGAHEDAPVRLHERRLIGENTVFSVFFDHVSGTGGQDVPQYLSVAPKNLTTDGLAGVCVLPVLGDRVGLIRIFRHPVRRWAWEAPKGFLDAAETPAQAVLRELFEETGYEAPADGLECVGTITPEPGVIQGRVQGFVARLDEDLNERSVAHVELGHDKVVFFSPKELAALIVAGGIEDAATLALLFLRTIK